MDDAIRGCSNHHAVGYQKSVSVELGRPVRLIELAAETDFHVRYRFGVGNLTRFHQLGGGARVQTFVVYQNAVRAVRNQELSLLSRL
ncbi:MAG: hypothetical protein AAF762_01330 [Pseudomonadota bacterium]